MSAMELPIGITAASRSSLILGLDDRGQPEEGGYHEDLLPGLRHRYSVYGRRPERTELTARSTSREAMEWIDGDVKREAILGATRTLEPAVR